MQRLTKNIEVSVKGKFSTLERRDLTKKEDYLMIFFCGVIKGEQGVHDGCNKIAESHW